MTASNAIFNKAELAFIKAQAGTMKNIDLHAAFVKKFGRTDITATQVLDCCGWRGWPRGIPRSPKGSNSYLHAGSLMVAVDTPDRYRQMQRVMWEEVFGPIPRGYMLIPLDGDKFNFDPFNWIMLTNSMMNRLRHSSFFTAPPELRPIIFTAAKLKQTIEDKTGRRLRLG